MEGEILKKSDLMEEIKRDLENLQRNEENFKLVQMVQDMIKDLDLSVLDFSENVICPSTPKRRKTSRAGLESFDEQSADKALKVLNDIEKQIKLVKIVLKYLNDIENDSFRKLISKNGRKRRNVISRVAFIQRIYENGQRIPLWLGLENEMPPPLCGAIEADDGYVADVGDMVAALIKQNKKENWILAEVISYESSTRQYTVDDIYEEPKAEQVLSYNKVIPLPKFKADPEINPEAIFVKDTSVLALYPGTTCFYRALVSKPPLKAEDPYQLSFEDENYESGYSSPIPVLQRFVLNYACYGYGEDCNR